MSLGIDEQPLAHSAGEGEVEEVDKRQQPDQTVELVGLRQKKRYACLSASSRTLGPQVLYARLGRTQVPEAILRQTVGKAPLIMICGRRYPLQE